MKCYQDKKIKGKIKYFNPNLHCSLSIRPFLETSFSVHIEFKFSHISDFTSISSNILNRIYGNGGEVSRKRADPILPRKPTGRGEGLSYSEG